MGYPSIKLFKPKVDVDDSGEDPPTRLSTLPQLMAGMIQWIVKLQSDGKYYGKPLLTPAKSFDVVWEENADHALLVLEDDADMNFAIPEVALDLAAATKKFPSPTRSTLTSLTTAKHKTN